MSFIDDIIVKAKNNKKTIILPESNDRRILEATEKILKNNIANIILIGSENVINDARVYYQTYDDDPNDFTEITKESSGTYSGYFKGISFTTSRKSQGYKLIIDKVSDYNSVDVKIVAIQKEVTNWWKKEN